MTGALLTLALVACAIGAAFADEPHTGATPDPYPTPSPLPTWTPHRIVASPRPCREDGRLPSRYLLIAPEQLPSDTIDLPEMIPQHCRPT